MLSDARNSIGLTSVTAAYDYYPFGMIAKAYNAQNYRHLYNGKEYDSEGMGGGKGTYDYGFRIYNPGLARFLSVDPLFASYPWYTPFQYAGNNPIVFIDLDGLERAHPSSQNKKNADRLKRQTAREIGRRQQNLQQNLIVIPKSSTDKTEIISGTTGKNFLNGDQERLPAETIDKKEPFSVTRDIDASFEGDHTVSTAASNIFEGSLDIPEGGVVENGMLRLTIDVAEGADPQTLRVKQGNFEIGPMGEENPMSEGDVILELKDQTGHYELTIPLKNIDPNTSFSVEFEGGNNQNVKVTGSIELSGRIEQ